MTGVQAPQLWEGLKPPSVWLLTARGPCRTPIRVGRRSRPRLGAMTTAGVTPTGRPLPGNSQLPKLQWQRLESDS